VQTTTREKSTWSLHGTLAELHAQKLAGRIDTARPNLGLHAIHSPESPYGTVRPDGERPLSDVSLTQSHTLSVQRIATDLPGTTSADAATWLLPIAESYVRGNDLVAYYEPVTNWPFSPQLYWRADTLQNVEGVHVSVSLLVSVQTHLLDTCPEISVSSRLPGGELILLAIADGDSHRIEPIAGQREIDSTNEIVCIVRRPQNLRVSHFEIMEFSDFRSVCLSTTAAGSNVEWRLFADFLEKGVIRRARVHTAFVPREHDIEFAAICCDAARHLELPLTT
jgi:hypothetical protein